MNPNEERLVWIDLETTGLDEDKDLILEVACIITNNELKEIGRFESVVAQHEGEVARRMGPKVRDMHHESSLLLSLMQAKADIHDVQRSLLRMFQDCHVGVLKGKLAGSTAAFDRRFLAKHMPLTMAFFDHRTFDTSTLKEAVRMWDVVDLLPKQEAWAKHRAMADIEYSLELARHVRKTYFKIVV